MSHIGQEAKVKIIFVDAENIGLKEVEKIQATVIDKVFVFSKAEAVKLHCEKKLYLYLSDYPAGNNQADFYVIACLARILSLLEKKHLSVLNVELFSNDENLISAFEFQSELIGVTSIIHRTKENVVVPLLKNANAIQNLTEAEEKIYKLLRSPLAFGPDFQSKVGLSKAEFTKAVNSLRNLNLIERSSESKKKWVRC